MAIVNTKQLIDAELEGRVRQYVWRKTPSQASTAGIWFDLSMSPGNPPAQYYIGGILTSTVLARSTDGGLQHGANVSPSTKYLRSVTAMTATATALPMPMILCDYLMCYPFVDMSVTDQQDMTNTNVLTRYTDGKGVQVMAVLTNAGTGGQSFFFTYTNSDGVSGRTSQTVQMNTATAIGSIVTSSVSTANQSGNPFIGLQSGDTGVRSIESVTMLGADVGLFALVLVKPLLWTAVNETTAPYEKDALVIGGDIPRIYDDAFLGFLALPRGTLAATALVGDIKVIWDS
jgi:hypothetical protein